MVLSNREETARRKYAEYKRPMGQRHKKHFLRVTEEVTALLSSRGEVDRRTQDKRQECGYGDERAVKN